MGVQRFQHGLSLVVGGLRVLKEFLQLGSFALCLGNQGDKERLRKGAFAVNGLDDLALQGFKLGGGLVVIGPDRAEQLFSLLHLFMAADIDDLAFWDGLRALKDLPHNFFNDTVKNVGRVPGLPVAFSFLSGFAVADIPHTLYNAVGIVLAGVGPAVCRESKPGAAMAAKDISDQKRVSCDVARDGTLLLCGISAGGAYPLGGLE